MTQANATGNGAPPRAANTDQNPTLGEALSCLSTTEKAVLLYLQSATLKATTVTVGATEIAERTGFSYPAVKAAIRSLEAQQLILCLMRGKSRYQPSRWKLLVSGESRSPQPRRASGHCGRAAGSHADRPVVALTWSDPPATVNELGDRHIQWARSYYRKPDGTESKEWQHIRTAVGHLRAVAGERAPDTLRAEDFFAIQRRMLEDETGGKGGQPYTRKYINTIIQRLIRMIRWATRPPQRWLSTTLLVDVQLIELLKSNRCSAREADPVRPVEWDDVAAVLPYVSRHIRAMILLQWTSGMRPIEVCTMRPGEIDQSGEIWLYRPTHHKTQHHGKDRTIPLDHEAQKVLRPFLIGRDADAIIFSPVEVAAESRAARHLERRTPIQRGNSPGTNVNGNPQRLIRERYDAQSYRQAIHRACDRAFPPPEHLQPRELPGGKREGSRQFHARLTDDEREELREWRQAHRWNPNQLRHSAATRFRKEYGIEAAQILLGHSNLRTTEIYAESSLDKLIGFMLNGKPQHNGSNAR